MDECITSLGAAIQQLDEEGHLVDIYIVLRLLVYLLNFTFGQPSYVMHQLCMHVRYQSELKSNGKGDSLSGTAQAFSQEAPPGGAPTPSVASQLGSTKLPSIWSTPSYRIGHQTHLGC